MANDQRIERRIHQDQMTVIEGDADDKGEGGAFIWERIVADRTLVAQTIPGFQKLSKRKSSCLK
jgi:hypothetical protein